MTVLYRAYDGLGQLLYIGITEDLRNRFYFHRSKSRWHPLMARRKVRKYATRKRAEAVEIRAIRMLRPKMNARYNEGYCQVNAPLSDEEMVAFLDNLFRGAEIVDDK